MFTTAGDVVRALKAYRDYYDPRSRSVLPTSRSSRDIDADPFGRGFLDSIEKRTELLCRLSTLDERERNILMLWYVLDLPVKDVCERLSLSRSHAYRLRDRALLELLDPMEFSQLEAAFA